MLRVSGAGSCNGHRKGRRCAGSLCSFHILFWDTLLHVRGPLSGCVKSSLSDGLVAEASVGIDRQSNYIHCTSNIDHKMYEMSSFHGKSHLITTAIQVSTFRKGISASDPLTNRLCTSGKIYSKRLALFTHFEFLDIGNREML